MKSIVKYCIIPFILISLLSCEKQQGQEQPQPEFVPELEVWSVTDSSIFATVYVNPEAADVYYYCSFMSAAEYDAMGGDEAILEWGAQSVPEIRKDLRQGDQNFETTGLEPETDYYVFLFQLSREGIAGSGVVKQKVTTGIREYPEFEAKITVSNIRSFMLTVSLKVEDVTDYFYVTPIAKSEYDAGSGDLSFMQDFFDGIVESYIDPDSGIGREEVLEGILLTGGGAQGNIMYLAPETGYVIALMRVEENGTVTGFVTEEAETVPMTVAEGEMSFSFDKYYDGSYLGFPGMAALPLNVSASGDITSGIYVSFRGDYTSESEYPDYLMYSMILGNSSAITDTPYIVYILPWDMDITLVGFGMDGQQNFSKVTRVKTHMTIDGASDIRDYLVPDDAQVAVSGEYECRKPEFVPAV